MNNYGHLRCHCGGVFELVLRPDTIHWAQRRCLTCARFAGWVRFPARMSGGELCVELARLEELLLARGARAQSPWAYHDLVPAGRRYRDSIPGAYRQLLRAAISRRARLHGKAGGPRLERTVWQVLSRLEAADGWIKGDAVTDAAANEDPVRGAGIA